MTPDRGFPVAEFETRLARAQARMAEHGLDAMLLTREAEFRYFTGYLTRFWESPTRPWFLVLPARGKPIAVIPGIGTALMRKTWVEDIRTWSAPDPEDDGVSLLADTLAAVTPENGSIAIPDGHETSLRMPLADLGRLQLLLQPRSFTTDHDIIRQLRMIKSAREVAKIREACAIAGRAFARVPEIAAPGVALDQVFRRFQMLCLEEGADWVPYLAGGAGPGGYDDVISPARPDPLCPGDVLMLDTGLVWDGYFCDFDRNWSVGRAAPPVEQAYETLIEATQAAAAIARPGQRAADLFAAMQAVLTRDATDTDAGRLGHGLGMSLTEWPSLIAADDTVLQPGMVLTLEPGISLGDRIMVHEENILITPDGAEYLSPVAPAGIPVL